MLLTVAEAPVYLKRVLIFSMQFAVLRLVQGKHVAAACRDHDTIIIK